MPELAPACQCPCTNVLHFDLVAFGPLAIAPCLDTYAATTEDDLRDSLLDVLGGLAIHDERIYAVLLDSLERSPELAAMYLAEYGDPRALPALSQVFDTLPVHDDDAMLGNQVFVELRCAIEELGGHLTAAQAAKAERADAPRRRFAAQMERVMERLIPQQPMEQTFSIPGPTSQNTVTQKKRNMGRNERCWCGSAKKYKKCHLDVD
jgi:SEC-C motif